MRPAGPLPETLCRSTPSTAAARAATGEAFTPSCLGEDAPSTGEESAAEAGAAAAGAASSAWAGPPFPSAPEGAESPVAMRAIT